MRLLPVLFIVMVSCNANEPAEEKPAAMDSPAAVTPADTTKTKSDGTAVIKPPEDSMNAEPARPVYANKRFKDVRVQKLPGNKYLVTGKGQIFEANFGWVIEDGHEELKSGHEMTDAGAPEWGNFSFIVTARKKRPNSKLHLVLYESSAKDGSRQHELPVLLY